MKSVLLVRAGFVSQFMAQFSQGRCVARTDFLVPKMVLVLGLAHRPSKIDSSVPLFYLGLLNLPKPLLLYRHLLTPHQIPNTEA